MELQEALAGTYAGDSALRAHHEQTIKRLSMQPMFASSCLHICSLPASQCHTALAAAICFKNHVLVHWFGQMPEGEKTTLRANLLHTLAKSPITLQRQLAHALHHVVSGDFPTRWPELVQQIRELLEASPTCPLVFCGTSAALHEMVKVFQWRMKPEREPLRDLVTVLFPLFLSTAGYHVTVLLENDSAHGIKNTLKSFRHAITLELPPSLMDAKVFKQWAEFLLKILGSSMPQESLFQSGRDGSPVHVTWALKKWAMRCVNRVFMWFGNPKCDSYPRQNASGLEAILFANTFSTNYAPTFLHVYLGIRLEALEAGFKLPNSIEVMISEFLTSSIYLPGLWREMQPHVEFIVVHILLGSIMPSEEHGALWHEDPIEYVMQRHQLGETTYDCPSGAAVDLLETILRLQRNTMVPTIFAFLCQILGETQGSETGASFLMAARKDGAFRILESLADVLCTKSAPLQCFSCTAVELMDKLILVHVLPEVYPNAGGISASAPFIQATAIKTSLGYVEMCTRTGRYTPTAPCSVVANGLFEFCISTLAKKNIALPLRVEATLALTRLHCVQKFREKLEHHATAILCVLLELNCNIEMDNVSACLPAFVERYANQVETFAAPLARHLCANFFHTIAAEGTNGQHDTQAPCFDLSGSARQAEIEECTAKKVSAALNLMRTVSTLISSIQNAPQSTFLEIEVEIAPTLHAIFDLGFSDIFEDVFDIIQSSISSCKTVTPAMWQLFEKIYKFVKSGTVDIRDLFPTFECYIYYGKDTLMSSPQIISALVRLIEEAINGNLALHHSDQLAGTLLAESMLLHLHGSMDEYFSRLVTVALAPLSMDSPVTVFEAGCIQLITNAMCLNLQAVMRVLEAGDLWPLFLSRWMSAIEKKLINHRRDLKVSILAICALLRTPMEFLPLALRDTLSVFLPALFELYKSVCCTIERQSKQEDFFNSLEKNANHEGRGLRADSSAPANGENEAEWLGDNFKGAGLEAEDLSFDEDVEEGFFIIDDRKMPSRFDAVDELAELFALLRSLQSLNPTVYTQLLHGAGRELIMELEKAEHQFQSGAWLQKKN